MEKNSKKIYGVLFLCLTISYIFADDKWQPASEGIQGKKAFDDLAKYYSNDKNIPPYEQKLVALTAQDSKIRSQAGIYLLVLLKQCFVDEMNGRAKWRQTHFWGGYTVSLARNLRKEIAKALSERAMSEEALPAAMWLIKKELLSVNQHAGVKVLCNIKSEKVMPLYKRILEQPHPNEYVVVHIIEEVKKRKLINLHEDVRRLCNHYRRKIRQAVRSTLSNENMPNFEMQSAFTPWLENQLQVITKMVYHKIPLDAKWGEITIKSNYRGRSTKKSYTGWLIKETVTKYSFVDINGKKHSADKSQCEIKFENLQDYIKKLENKRKEGISRQFEPNSISRAESFITIWYFARGDKKTTARILFPCLDSMNDDRWLVWMVRDILGHLYHKEMLRAFSQ